MSTSYSAILSNVSLANSAEPVKLYAQLIPEKPSALAEERVFVYIPKATYNTAGIAKFTPTQFVIINTEVSLRPQFIQELQEVISQPAVVVSEDEPGSQLWYKVISSTE